MFYVYAKLTYIGFNYYFILLHLHGPIISLQFFFYNVHHLLVSSVPNSGVVVATVVTAACPSHAFLFHTHLNGLMPLRGAYLHSTQPSRYPEEFRARLESAVSLPHTGASARS